MALDLSGPTAPPRTTKAIQAEHKKLSGKLAARKEAAQGVAQLAGFGLIVTRQYADAGAIGLHADPIIGELVALSDTNERVGKALDYLTEAGPYAGLVIATLPLVMQIMANHGMVKAELVAGSGVVPPQMLESQVRADMARQAAGALRAQQEAEAELAAMADAMRQQQQAEAPDGPPNGRSRQSSRAGGE
jgi:hypothetical protein